MTSGVGDMRGVPPAERSAVNKQHMALERVETGADPRQRFDRNAKTLDEVSGKADGPEIGGFQRLDEITVDGIKPQSRADARAIAVPEGPRSRSSGRFSAKTRTAPVSCAGTVRSSVIAR